MNGSRLGSGGIDARVCVRIGTLLVSLVVTALGALGCSRSGISGLFVTEPGADGGASGSGGNSGGGGGTSNGGTGGVLGNGGVTGGPCTVDADCASTSSCTTPRCIGGMCAQYPLDRDGDGFGDIACGGDDCNDLNPHAFPRRVEDCTDGTDNDCNGVADCNDPACSIDSCGCVPQLDTEICDDGVDNDCDGQLDCFDPDCVGTPVCGCSAGEVCGNGIDDDCDGLSDCNSPSCAGTPECTCRLSRELCFGYLDEDCDGLIDCMDPDCTVTGLCQCTGAPHRELCTGYADEDCDGLFDCVDPDCTTDPACAHCTTEDCSNGVDDDCDGTIDCADSGCRFEPSCAPKDELCQNGVDDDRDGAIDCADSDCASNPACVTEHSACQSAFIIRASGSYFGDTTGFDSQAESTRCGGAVAGEAVFRLVLTVPTGVSLDTIGSTFDTTLYVRRGNCSSGRELACDDDSGGDAWSSKLTFPVLQPGDYFIFVDGFTVGAAEGPYALNVNLGFQPTEVCGNGTDDDGDRYADCADPDCAETAACRACGQPKPEFGVAACTNGVDDDCDGKIDCADDDCSASPDYPTECCDGIDPNGNGIPDDFACRCASDGDCPGDADVCYLHSTGACALGCGDFVGDICAVNAPGSRCNQDTRQCEF